MTERREKPYICVDTDLPDHDRLLTCDDPAGCLGLWVALTAYSRQYLTDGKVPKKYAVAKWGDRKNAVRLAQMSGSGLLVDHGSWYEILRYAPRNQTKAMVEDARGKARTRMANVRANKSRTGGEVPVGFVEHAQVVPTSISLSLSSLVTAPDLDRDPGGSTRGGAAPAAAAAESGTLPIAKTISYPRPTLAPVPRVIDPELALTDDARAQAEMLGFTQTDVIAYWKKFKAKCADQGWTSCDFYAKWSYWIADQVKYAREDRERARQRGQDGPAAAGGPAVTMSPAKPPSGPPEPVATPEETRAAVEQVRSNLRSFGKTPANGRR